MHADADADATTVLNYYYYYYDDDDDDDEWEKWSRNTFPPRIPPIPMRMGWMNRMVDLTMGKGRRKSRV